MKQIQNKVEKITLKYMELYPEEYKDACVYIEGERQKQSNKFGSTGGDRTIDRKIHEMPVTLYDMICDKLTAEELSKTKKGEEGKTFARWFATRFPEFRSSDLI